MKLATMITREVNSIGKVETTTKAFLSMIKLCIESKTVVFYMQVKYVTFLPQNSIVFAKYFMKTFKHHLRVKSLMCFMF